jgi:hypothetical protein
VLVVWCVLIWKCNKGLEAWRVLHGLWVLVAGGWWLVAGFVVVVVVWLLLPLFELQLADRQ